MNNLINDNFIFDLILGSLLGDGSIEKPSGLSKEYTISFHQSKEKESKYIKLKHDIISTKFNINNIRPGNNNTLRFSLSHRLTKDKEFTEMIRPLVRDIDNNRIFPDINLVTPVVLLFWYLDDGSFPISKQIRKSGKINIHRKIKITLQSYKDEDIIRFTELLNDKFDLNFKTSTQIIKNQIKITDIIISNNIKEITKFLDLIYPYKEIISKDMHYKFCLAYHNTKLLQDSNLSKYNNCDFHNTGICSCRHKDLSLLFK